jgi:hypothetical protein
MNTLPRLRTGDLVRYDGQACRVVHVNDCAAVIAITKPARQFITRFDKRVSIQPKPQLVRISPNSEIQIL